jgi:hypothetical protein
MRVSLLRKIVSHGERQQHRADAGSVDEVLVGHWKHVQHAERVSARLQGHGTSRPVRGSPLKALQLTRRRRSACQVSQPAGGRVGSRSAGGPPEYHGATRAARS